MRTHCVPPRALGGEGARETENDLEERKAGWNQTAARSRGPFDSAGCGGLEKEKNLGPDSDPRVLDLLCVRVTPRVCMQKPRSTMLGRSTSTLLSLTTLSQLSHPLTQLSGRGRRSKYA